MKRAEHCFHAGRMIGRLQSEILCAEQALENKKPTEISGRLWDVYETAGKAFAEYQENEEELSGIRQRAGSMAKKVGGIKKLSAKDHQSLLNSIRTLRTTAMLLGPKKCMG